MLILQPFRSDEGLYFYDFNPYDFKSYFNSTRAKLLIRNYNATISAEEVVTTI